MPSLLHIPNLPALIERYESGQTLGSLARELGTSHGGLKNAFKRAGVAIRGPKPYTHLPRGFRQIITDRYLSNESQTAIATDLGIDRASVRNTLLAAGMTPKSQGDACRKLGLDQHAFDVATDDAAYWVGFLMADGSIGLRRGQPWMVSLTLSSKDVGHLDKFRAFVKSEHTYIYGSPYMTKRAGEQRAVKLSFTSRIMAARLAEFGVVHRKTYCARAIGLDCNSHFWRGMIDGDGTICFSVSAGRPKLDLKLCGARDVIEQFAAYCRRYVSTTAKPRYGRGVWVFALADDSARTILGTLYTPGTVALDRKRVLAERAIGDRRNGQPAKVDAAGS